MIILLFLVDNGNCDKLERSNTSPGWQGAAWYRLAEPAGTKIPENPVGKEHCNSFNTGWLNGHHPATVGETINGKVCFSGQVDACFLETQIQIKHCTSYYLYYLEEPSECNSRYCSTSITLIGNEKQTELKYFSTLIIV